MKESKAAFLIILANIYGFVLVHYSMQTDEFIQSLILNPENLTKGNWLSIITSGFVHVNGLHIFLNMLGVYAFGRIVERHFGFVKTLFIYFGSLCISLLFATLMNWIIFDKTMGIIGASGAVMGLLATAMLLDPFAVTHEMILPIPVMVKGWMYFYADLMGLLSPKPDGVSHLAHMFGFLSIFLLIYFLSHKDKKRLKDGLIVNIFSLAFFLVAWRAVYLFKTGELSFN